MPQCHLLNSEGASPRISIGKVVWILAVHDVLCPTPSVASHSLLLVGSNKNNIGGQPLSWATLTSYIAVG